MGPMTVRITVAFCCFILLVLLAGMCFVLFLCNNNHTNRDAAMVGDIRNRKTKLSKNDSLFP